MCVCALDQCWLVCGRPGRRDNLHTMGQPKLQALVYDILPLEEGAEKRCRECGASPPPFPPLRGFYHMVISGYLDHQSTQFRLSASELLLFVSVVLVLINALYGIPNCDGLVP